MKISRWGQTTILNRAVRVDLIKKVIFFCKNLKDVRTLVVLPSRRRWSQEEKKASAKVLS